jgi:hypothetical protein
MPLKQGWRTLDCQDSYEEVVKTITGTTGGHVPKRQAEQLVQRVAQDFDVFYDRRQCRPCEEKNTGTVLVITVDGKGVVLHK